MELEVINAHFSYPRNARWGFYIELRGERKDLTGELGLTKARELAAEYGFKPYGSGGTGLPWQTGVGIYSMAYWFHDPLQGDIKDWRPPKPEVWQYPRQLQHRKEQLGF